LDILVTETKKENSIIREYVFLLDTSGSMKRDRSYPEGDHGPLYPKLRQTIKEFIDAIKDDLDEIGVELQFYFYPFDEGIAKQAGNEIFSISSSEENYKEEIKKYIDKIEFSGNYTHICSSLQKVLENHKATDHPVIIRLYTDGEENETHPTTGEVLYPPWEKFWGKIQSLQDGITWTENENVLIITLEIEWPSPPPIDHLYVGGGGLPPDIYSISVYPQKLDFKNLYDIGEGVGEITFSILNKDITWNEFTKKYPELLINITPQEFPSEIGNFIPKYFPPIKLKDLIDEKYNLIFKIDQNGMIKNKKYGKFNGQLTFSIEENNISIGPFIPIKFHFYQSEVVITLPSPREGKVPIDFGVIKEEKQYKQKIILQFNQQAVDKKSNLRVSVDISPDNPSILKIGENLLINGKRRESIDIIPTTKETEEIELVLEVKPSELKYGKYYGRINFTSEELNIKDDNLSTDDMNPNQKYYEWTFTIPMPPWMKILIGIIGLVVLLIIICLVLIIRRGGSISLPSLKYTKAAIPDETYLYIRNYETGKREQINISGKVETIIGKDGQYLNDIEERMILRAIREDGKNLVRLTVESGKVTLIKAGSTKEETVIDQTIFNRDVIKFSNYQIRVSSLYLERDIN